MNPYYRPSNPGNSLQQAHVDGPEQPSCQIDGFPKTRTSRLVNYLKPAVRRIVCAISRWRQRRTTIRRLQALNDHYLKDIGIDRFQIVSTVTEAIEVSGRSAWYHARFCRGDHIGRGSHEIHREPTNSTEKKQA